MNTHSLLFPALVPFFLALALALTLTFAVTLAVPAVFLLRVVFPARSRGPAHQRLALFRRLRRPLHARARRRPGRLVAFALFWQTHRGLQGALQS